MTVNTAPNSPNTITCFRMARQYPAIMMVAASTSDIQRDCVAQALSACSGLLTWDKARVTLDHILFRDAASKGVTMSTQAHLEALKAKHQALEARLADAIAHASSSDQELAAIKHQKLKLKDEITELERR